MNGPDVLLRITQFFTEGGNVSEIFSESGWADSLEHGKLAEQILQGFRINSQCYLTLKLKEMVPTW